MERLKYLRQLGQNDTRFTGRVMKAMWDQDVVNDIYEQWLHRRETFRRSCIAFPTECLIPQCCTPTFSPTPSNPLVPKVVNERRIRFEHNRSIGDGFHVGMGYCNRDKRLVVHRNVCDLGIKRYDTELNVSVDHVEWLRRVGCWYTPLDALLSTDAAEGP